MTAAPRLELKKRGGACSSSLSYWLQAWLPSPRVPLTRKPSFDHRVPFLFPSRRFRTHFQLRSSWQIHLSNLGACACTYTYLSVRAAPSTPDARGTHPVGAPWSGKVHGPIVCPLAVIHLSSSVFRRCHPSASSDRIAHITADGRFRHPPDSPPRILTSSLARLFASLVRWRPVG